jgi:hypothetical protein
VKGGQLRTRDAKESGGVSRLSGGARRERDEKVGEGEGERLGRIRALGRRGTTPCASSVAYLERRLLTNPYCSCRGTHNDAAEYHGRLACGPLPPTVGGNKALGDQRVAGNRTIFLLTKHCPVACSDDAFTLQQGIAQTSGELVATLLRERTGLEGAGQLDLAAFVASLSRTPARVRIAASRMALTLTDKRH